MHPRFFSLLVGCQLVALGVDSISTNGLPPFRLRIMSWYIAV
jgi:hypothetical protein